MKEEISRNDTGKYKISKNLETSRNFSSLKIQWIIIYAFNVWDFGDINKDVSYHKRYNILEVKSKIF